MYILVFCLLLIFTSTAKRVAHVDCSEPNNVRIGDSCFHITDQKNTRSAATFYEDDQIFHTQDEYWNLDRIDQPSLPLDGKTFQPINNASGMTIYILDTGVYAAHNDFEGRASLGINLVSGESGDDGAGHGTHCAGIAAGKTYGVAKAATIIGVKVMDSNGTGTLSDIIQGIAWITNHNNGAPNIISMSIGGSRSNVLNTAVKAAGKTGMTIVAAAGNQGANAAKYSPASAGGNPYKTGVLTVGATDDWDYRDYYSNFGKNVDIFAPGSDITSTWIGSPTATETLSGTSMATPHVAGAMAVLIKKNNMNRAKALKDLITLSAKNKVKSAKTRANRIVQVP